MVKLKNKIKTINSLPDIKKEFPTKKVIGLLCFLVILIPSLYIGYIKILPYINSVNINKIIGKRVYYSDCNTKDYIIISSDKSFNLSITDNNCKTMYYEGDIVIKNNEITFNNNISGIIDNDYNIIINNNIFEVEHE